MEMNTARVPPQILMKYLIVERSWGGDNFCAYLRPTLNVIAQRIKSNANYQLNELTSHRACWKLLSVGALRRSLDIDDQALKGQWQCLVDAFKTRILSGPERPFAHDDKKTLIDRIIFNQTRCEKINAEAIQEFSRHPDILRSPATEEDIVAAETRIGQKLPTDYKDFVRITDGLPALTVHLRSYLRSIELVQQRRESWHQRNLRVELLPNLVSKLEWPLIESRMTLNAGGDEGETFYIEPKLVEEAKARFLQYYDSKTVKEKKFHDRVVNERYGSMNRFKTSEWAIMTWSHWGVEINSWPSVRLFLEHLAVEVWEEAKWTDDFDTNESM